MSVVHYPMSREKLKFWFSADLGDYFSGGEKALTAALGTKSGIKINANKNDELTITAPETSFTTKLTAKAGTVHELITNAIESLGSFMKARPDWYPANRFPFGCGDFRFTYFAEGVDDNTWYIQGEWSPNALKRTPANLTPDKCIDRLRSPTPQKSLVSSRPFAELERVYLIVSGTGKELRVENIYTNRAEFDPAATPSAKCIEYPEARLPALSWPRELFIWQTAGTQALQGLSFRRAGKSADWLRSISKEAVFVGQVGSRPARDLRASLISGPEGPAPLPEGTEWPRCPCCGERALFSQSLDFRDMSFSSLLPGTTAVIFVCAECHMAGEWNRCSQVVWLGESQPIILAGTGPNSNLVQLEQQHGFDRLDRSEMNPEALREIEELEQRADLAGIWMAPSYGTKAGGVPHYLQHDAFFFDKRGVAMEYIGQIATPEHIPCGGFGYLFYSVNTGETYIEFQDT